jgi:hypothetical protein
MSNEGHFGTSSKKEKQMAYTMDTKVDEILMDAKAMAKGMTLKQIVGMLQAKQARITEEMALSVLAKVNTLKK